MSLTYNQRTGVIKYILIYERYNQDVSSIKRAIINGNYDNIETKLCMLKTDRLKLEAIVENALSKVVLKPKPSNLGGRVAALSDKYQLTPHTINSWCYRGVRVKVLVKYNAYDIIYRCFCDLIKEIINTRVTKLNIKLEDLSKTDTVYQEALDELKIALLI